MTARQRQVFPRDEVAHLWAHKAQDSARDAQHNFYFTGPTIYSYGSHFAIAHILSDECGADLAGRVLWNTSSYSNTTAKHKSIAWQALTRQQRDGHLNVPGLNQDEARAIDRALCEKRLPEATATLLQYVRDNVAALAGKKHGSGPFCDALRKAREYEETARLFYARAGRKYPLPLIPANSADIPADKATRDAFIMTFARADIERQYRENLKRAQDGLTSAIDALENPDASAAWHMHSRNAQGARDRARSAACAANKALVLYSRLHGADKKSRAAQALINKLAPVFKALETRVIAAEKAELRERVERQIKRFAHARGMVRKGSTLYHHVNGLQESIYHAAGITGEVQAAGIPADSWMHDAAAKMARANAFDSLAREITATRRILETANSYFPTYMSDAKREYARAVRKWAYINSVAAENNVSPKAFAHFAGDIADSIKTANARIVEIDAAIHARNAEAIAAWIAGESDKRPTWEAGTFARINKSRGIVETTRGASVPIEHACRLARLYRVTVRRGGQEWRDGAGPMVGHYRVNSIGADGALVIGCHEFSPTEAQRLESVLMACQECATVPA